jgi:hypothetical protein
VNVKKMLSEKNEKNEVGACKKMLSNNVGECKIVKKCWLT